MRYGSVYLAVLTGSVFLLGAGDAAASSLIIRENSAESLATIYAGNASRADDVATVFNNPAGMSLLAGTQVEIGAAAVSPSLHYSGNATILGFPVPGTNDRNVGQVALIPHLYAVFDIDDRLKAGIAITVPFGFTVDYAEDWPGRYLAIKAVALTTDINPNVSYRINDHLSIAGGVSLQYLKIKRSAAIAQFAIFGAPVPDGGFMLDADDWAWGYNLGILGEPVDGTRVGLTYRSGVAHRIEGMLTLTPATSPLLGLVDAPVSAGVNLPASITGSVTHQLTPDLSISSDVQFTQWHTFKQISAVSPPNPTLTYNENYRDSWMVSVGGTYRLNQAWSLRAGAGFDESPVVDAFRDTGVPDKNRYMLGLGAGYRFSETMGLDLGYAHYFAAGLASMDSSINAIDPITGVVLHGRYDNALDYVALTFRAGL